MNRRDSLQMILTTSLTLGLAGLPVLARTAPALTQQEINAMRNNWRDLAPVDYESPRPEDKVELSQEEWRDRLTAEQFRVMRKAGTEQAYTSPLNDESRDGLFVCLGCQLPLFTSAMKYDSGTGWPSFFTSIADVFATKTDFKLLWPRTEYHCRRCGSHHGHVFKDGPPPTGERWCNNGVALKFIASD